MQGMTNTQLHKVNSVMMRNDKVDGMLYHNLSIKLSNISDEQHTYPQRVQA